TVANNSVTSQNSGAGGGVETDSAVTIRNSTIAFNSVTSQFQSRGGGIFLTIDGPGVQLVDANAIAGNTVAAIQTEGPDCDTNGSPVGGKDNVVGISDACDLSGTNNVMDTATPGLNPLANNGGPTDTVSLLESSPAMDHVPTADCPPPATDE